MTTPMLLRAAPLRAQLMRRDTAETLTRLFYLERSLILSQAGWLPVVERIDAKALLARLLWEDAVAADGLRNRVLELRYPNRVIAPDQHQQAIALFDSVRSAPTQEAFMLGLAQVLLPALCTAYAAYQRLSDRLSDGPSALLLKHALADKLGQISDLAQLADQLLDLAPARRTEAVAWVNALTTQVAAFGENLLASPTDNSALDALPGSRPFTLPIIPGRDSCFACVRYYWPHIVDPTFPSSEGIDLQMRSAIGHLNEVWAAEICAVNLYNFADTLGWDFIRDLARWTYDESRHCLMGLERLTEWGFAPADLPLGDYIYVATRQQEPLFGLAMIFYFETKYIHRGRERIKTFTAYADQTSRHDYEFDWADETFHAEYGKHWLTVLLKGRTAPPHDLHELRHQCEATITAAVAECTDEERRQIRAIADRLLAQAKAQAATN
jgi:hypothetical protein